MRARSRAEIGRRRQDRRRRSGPRGDFATRSSFGASDAHRSRVARLGWRGRCRNVLRMLGRMSLAGPHHGCQTLAMPITATTAGGSMMIEQSRAIDSVTDRFTTVDIRITSWLAEHGIPFLRVGLGIVFLWFGLLKFVPGVSAAEDLAPRTIAILTF